MDVGEAEVAALESERQPLVVEPQQVQYRGVQIVHVAVAVDRTKAKLIRGLAETASADGTITPREINLLRAIATTLDCPMPLIA